MTPPKKAGEVPPSGEERDHYRLLQIDPDAPAELIVEAYWYVAGKLRAEQMAGKAAKQDLLALNAAYADLVTPERRHAYDATVPRVAELRRTRAERRAADKRRSLLPRLFGRASARKAQRGIDYYAILGVDPQADAPLIARAYAILHALHSKGDANSRQAADAVTEIEKAYSMILDSERRADYDISLTTADEAAEAKKKEETTRETKPSAVATSLPQAIIEATKPAPAEVSPAKEPEGPKTARRRPSLAPLSNAMRTSGRFLGRCAALAGRSGARGASWTAVQGGTTLLVLARAPRLLIRQWRNNRSHKQSTDQADLLDQRVLRDAVPPLLHKNSEKTKATQYQARLLVADTSGRSEVIALEDKPITLGSDHTCDVVLEADGGLVAAAHAQIWFTGDNFVIRSLNPRYATRIGGSKVNWAMLDDGDEIEIGRCRIRFETAHPSGSVPEYLRQQHGPH